MSQPANAIPQPFARRLTSCVAIPTYLREQVLLDTIADVLAQNPPADEILVVDQSPEHEPATAERLQLWHDEGAIRWIHHSPPNLPGARNRALRETQCDIIIFIDDDVVLTPRFVANHMANYSDDRIHAVAGRTLQPWGHLYHPPEKPWPRIIDYARFPLESTERFEGIANFPGGNHSVRHATIVSIGGYDEGFIGPAAREDSDAAIRLWRTGRLIVYDPKACLKHLAAPSGGCQMRIQLKPQAGWLRFFGEHYFLLRHHFPSRWYWRQTLLHGPRANMISRAALRRPWQIPLVFVRYVQALFHAAAARPRRNYPRAATSPVTGSESALGSESTCPNGK